MAWCGEAHWAPRLRLCMMSKPCGVAPMHGVAVITGGLGGLGLCAAAQLVACGMAGVLLSSRSGHVQRSGQGLLAQLAALRAIATLTISDVGDVEDARYLLIRHRLSRILHAAGVLQDKLLRVMAAGDLHTSFEPKALAASRVHSIAACTPPEALGLFSSVAATLGNVGQGNYAAANSYLDALASCRRQHGSLATSLQIPAVSGAGMGASTFSESQLDVMGAISLSEFGTWLSRALTPAVASAERTQACLPSSLLANADAAQRRFEELVARGHVEPFAPRVSLGSGETQLLATSTPSQRWTHVEVSVLRAVGELTGAPSAALTAETPLMEAGVDSLAATELASRLRALTGVALSPTLVFEQPTPRAIVAHSPPARGPVW